MTLSSHIAELRNLYGSGHGKSASYKGLTTLHAKLAVGSNITLVNYLWDTYECRKQSGRIAVQSS
ncbi:MAG: abortive infection family protein [Coriobacteriales bacterium]|nr:abortive infection family protein [Coriobacteriales bacterium]